MDTTSSTMVDGNYLQRWKHKHGTYHKVLRVADTRRKVQLERRTYLVTKVIRGQGKITIRHRGVANQSRITENES